MSLGSRDDDDRSKRIFLGKKVLRSSEKSPRRSDEAKPTGRPELSEDSDAQNNGEKPRWLDHLGGVLFCGFANDLGRVIDQAERDFTGAHFENCLREDRGQHDSFARHRGVRIDVCFLVWLDEVQHFAGPINPLVQIGPLPVILSQRRFVTPNHRRHLMTRHATTPVHPLQAGLFQIREVSLDREGFIRRNFLRMDHHGHHVNDHNDD